MSLLVTGGAGFIGSNLVYHALEHTADRLVIVDKLTYAGSLLTLERALTSPRVTFIEADIADGAAMTRAFAEHRPRAVLNLAAETHVDRSIDGPTPFVQTNIVGTFTLLEAARAFVAGLSAADRSRFRFLHVSTDEVYGTLGEDGMFAEYTPYAPNSPYAASKAAADHLVRAYHHTYGLPVLITNCSNNYGPYQFPEKLIPLVVLNAVDGKPLPVYGDGGNVRDWLHVEDHCAGLLRVLDKGRPGEKYNIGGGSERTNLQVVDRICESLDALQPPSTNPCTARCLELPGARTFVPIAPYDDGIDATKVGRLAGAARDFDGIHETGSGICSTAQAAPPGRPLDRERLAQASTLKSELWNSEV